MKIEPIKKTNLPKYAAALMALSMVPMYAGCGRQNVQYMSDGPVPVETQPFESRDETLALGGEVALTDAFISSAAGEDFIEGFARQGITLKKTDSPADLAGNYEGTWFIDRDNRILICCYDNDGQTACFHENGAKEYDWGYAGEAQYPHGQEAPLICRTAFVNARKYWDEGFSADVAEQIAKDLLSRTGTKSS